MEIDEIFNRTESLIQPSEIMRGNYFKFHDKVVRVYGYMFDDLNMDNIMTIREDGQILAIPRSGLEPIEITREFLSKNGFECTSERNDEKGDMEKWIMHCIAWVYCFSNGDMEFEMINYNQGEVLDGAKFRGVLRYVHQVQNVFNICNINKTLEV